MAAAAGTDSGDKDHSTNSIVNSSEIQTDKSDTDKDTIAFRLSEVYQRMKNAANLNKTQKPVRLVAVGKTKPIEMLKEAYESESKQRNFGENYVQELIEKVQLMQEHDINWHFIGHLQGNKVKPLLKGVFFDALVEGPDQSVLQSQTRRLVIETIDSVKLAKSLNQAMEQLICPKLVPKLPVFIQINSSSEESKNGVSVIDSELDEVVLTILQECPRLQLTGLMTIGAPDYSGCRTEDFETMVKCKKTVMELLKRASESDSADVEPSGLNLELSMGMSNDFEIAIREGSDSVRVGSSIFGARAKKN